MNEEKLSAYDYLTILAQRQKDFTKDTPNLSQSHSDFPIPALSQLLGMKAISGTHAYGFLITQEGINMVEKMYPNTLTK